MGSTVSIEEIKTAGNLAFSTHNYTWDINNFSNSVPTVGKTIYVYFNSTINNEVYQWSLILYPKGFNDRVKNYTSLWLKKLSPLEKRIEFSCAIVNADGEEVKTKTITKTLALESVLGWVTFCKRDFILDEENKILKDDKLSLKCTLRVYEDKEILTAEIEDGDPFLENSSSEVCRSLRSLLESGKFSDFSIKVEDEIFPVHRAILSARSVVFCTMLLSKLQKSNEIKITDISKAAVQEMLRYIYYGNTSILDFDMATELFYAADKYEIFSMKKKCSNFIASNLDTTVAVRVLLLADRHHDDELKDVTVRYVSKHAAEITNTDEWFELMSSHQKLANKVVLKLIPKTKEK